jgi:flagellar biosynthesis chaperone FliJ
MSKIDELDKLDKTLKDAELHLKSIESTMEKIDKELVSLSARKTELENNMAFHKKENTIPIVNEYRKSKT